MERTTFRGVVRQGQVELLDQPPPADGTEVIVVPVTQEPGTPGALLAAMTGPPHLPPEWLDEFEQLLAEGRRPPLQGNPLTEPPDGSGEE